MLPLALLRILSPALLLPGSLVLRVSNYICVFGQMTTVLCFSLFTCKTGVVIVLTC